MTVGPTITQLTMQVGQWSRRNFGDQVSKSPFVKPGSLELGSLAPLMGIGEELGELQAAREEGNSGECFDAVGDIGIYLLDYAYREKHLYLGELFDRTVDFENEDRFPAEQWLSLAWVHYGNLLHHTLKLHQGIRGYDCIIHYKSQRDTSIHLFVETMKRVALKTVGQEFHDIILHVWQQVVSKRNWGVNPNESVEGSD